MRRKSAHIAFLALALASFLTASCDKEQTPKTTEAPTVTVSTASFTVLATGGAYSFTYSVSNPISDGTTSVSADVSWIRVTDVAADGTVSFTIAQNGDDGLRTGNVTVIYGYTTGSAAKSVGVVQYGRTDPVLTVLPNEITASSAGGTYGFTCEIDNPASDGTLSCEADADWITDFDCSDDGTVSFTVARSLEETLRSSAITVTYIYGTLYGSGAVSREVTVVQDHPGAEALVSDIVGTYTATALLNGQGYSNSTGSWTIRIFAYTGSSGYDLYIDGILPMAATYDTYGDFRTSACAYYTDGTIVIPSQCSAVTTISSSSGSSYYLGFTPCVQYANGNYAYSKNFPACTFTGDALTGTWESDYGIFVCGCTTAGDITTMTTYFQAAAPTITLTKTSSTTSALTENGCAQARPDGPADTPNVTDGNMRTRLNANGHNETRPGTDVTDGNTDTRPGTDENNGARRFADLTRGRLDVSVAPTE